MKKVVVLLFIMIISLALIGCSKPAPEKPIVEGVEEGKIYGEPIEISLKQREEDVQYRSTIDGEEYELGSPYEKEGEHTLVIEATRDEKSTELEISFEIDTIPPETPSVAGIEENKIYFKSVKINVEKVEGVSYKTTIDDNEYELGSTFEEEGEHVFRIVAVKERNNLSVEKEIPFTIDNTTYTQKEVNYFTEIALGAEYGGSPYVKKWVSDVRIKVGGNPTENDLKKLRGVVGELNDIIQTIELSIVEDNENINMYFVPQGDFREYIPGAVKGNVGYFTYYTKGKFEIDRATILIGTFGTNQRDRSHLIIEEVTQALGMGKDSPKYKDSIFHEYEGESLNQEYSKLDKKVIEILYREDISLGMDKNKVLERLSERIVSE
ncbi:DUF2927 domain-containing protein [Clostridium sp. D2Q-11]|uniref:DUF2927 domain-containing protein n=1 Tax=Anaeromonas frigoriresistens TaxID=2683708 RepID=A0A942ZAA5_9FIRM|nr:DUF2927 domain-containing protein [Anaeromonas frigoriresistens]MBS4539615.1 DUF2927 domain-containing protein [Anaeromonas frigoriresistens]